MSQVCMATMAEPSAAKMKLDARTCRGVARVCLFFRKQFLSCVPYFMCAIGHELDAQVIDNFVHVGCVSLRAYGAGQCAKNEMSKCLRTVGRLFKLHQFVVSIETRDSELILRLPVPVQIFASSRAWLIRRST